MKNVIIILLLLSAGCASVATRENHIPSDEIILRFDGLSIKPNKNKVVITNAVDEFAIEITLASDTRTKNIFVSSDLFYMFSDCPEIRSFKNDGTEMRPIHTGPSLGVPTPNSYALLDHIIDNEGSLYYWNCTDIIYKRKLVFSKEWSVKVPERDFIILPPEAHKVTMKIPILIDYYIMGKTNRNEETFFLNAEIILKR